MKKVLNKLLPVMTAVLVTGLSVPVNAVAEESESNKVELVVMAVNEWGECWLTNDCNVSSHAVSSHTLQPGDVVSVTTGDETFFLETCPVQYAGEFEVTYLGRAEELYPEYVEELTVVEVTEYGYPVWSDAKGNTYETQSFDPRNSDWYEYKCSGISPFGFSIGDTALCMTVFQNYSGNVQTGAVILEKRSEAPHTAGDATGDGKTDIVDVIAVNKHILLGELLSQAGIDAVDFNGDGKVDATESLILLKYVVKIVDDLLGYE